MAAKLPHFIAFYIPAFMLTCLHVCGQNLEETCNKGGKLTVMYWHHCPYIMRASREHVSGIFPHVLSSMVKKCCHSDVQLKYRQMKGPADFYTAVDEKRFKRSDIFEVTSARV